MPSYSPASTAAPSPRLDRNNQAVPLQTIFRVRMDRCTGLDSTSRELSGSVLIGRERRGLLTLWWRRLAAVTLIKEDRRFRNQPPITIT